MQITRQADYALRAMIYLAKLEPNQRAATSQIAEVQHIPPILPGQDYFAALDRRLDPHFARRSGRCFAWRARRKIFRSLRWLKPSMGRSR